jgi:hypothetical protein
MDQEIEDEPLQTIESDAPAAAEDSQSVDSGSSNDSQDSNESLTDVMAEFAAADLIPDTSTKKLLPTEPKIPPQPKKGEALAPKDQKLKSAEDGEDGEKKAETTEDLLERLRKEATVTKPVAKDESSGRGKARNYAADLPPEYHGLAKNMGNDAYSEFVKVVKERDTLKSDRTVKTELGVPITYFENENGYMLSPEFQAASSYVSQADAVLAHWEKQKALIADGEDWQDLEQDSQGRIVLGSNRPASEDAKFTIGQYIQHAAGQKQNAVQQAQEIKQQFVGRSQAAIKFIREQEDLHLPQFKDPKSPLHGQAAEIMKGIPAELRGSPFAQTVAKITAVNRTVMAYVPQILNELKEAKAQIAKLTGGKGVPAGNNGAVKGTETSGGRSKVAQGDIPLEDLEGEFKEFL